MKNLAVVPALLLASLSVVSLQAQPVHKRGTDVLHYSIREAFAADTNVTAQGRVDLSRKEQGNAQKQTLDLSLKGLNANGSYLLLSWDRVASNYTYVTSFSADSKGRAALRYRNQGNGQSLGNGKSVLPAALSPVSGLEELVIADPSTQAVLRADLRTPDKLSYLVKRDLSTDKVGASLRLNANQQKAQLKLAVAGLTPTADYYLVLNGSVTETNAPDSRSRLVINRTFTDPLDALRLTSLAIWDVNTNVVIHTTLP